MNQTFPLKSGSFFDGLTPRDFITLIAIVNSTFFISFFFKDDIYFFRERGREEERKEEEHGYVRTIDQLPFTSPQPGTWPATQVCALIGNQNQQPFSLQAGTQPNEPHQPGLFSSFLTLLQSNTID